MADIRVQARWWLPWAIAALVAYTACHFLVSGIITPIRHGHLGDFITALHMLRNANIGVFYGPLFSWIDLLTRPWDERTTLGVFFWLNHVFVGVAWLLWLLVWHAKGARLPWQAWAWHGIVWFNFYPLYKGIGETNIELSELMLMSLAFWCWFRAHPVFSGIALGVAAMLKFLPGAVWPYFWLRRERLICWTMAVTTVLICGLSMWGLRLTLPQLFKPIMPAFELWSNFDNQTLQGFAYRLFSHIDLSPGASSYSDPIMWNVPAATLVGWGLRIAVMVLTVWWAWRFCRVSLPPEEHRLRLGCEYMGVMTTMVLTAPHNHMHYFALILPAYTVLLVSWWRRPQLWSRPLFWCALASYLLMGYVVPLSLLDRFLPPLPVPYIHLFMLYSLPMFGACLLWGVLGVMVRRLARASEVSQPSSVRTRQG